MNLSDPTNLTWRALAGLPPLSRRRLIVQAGVAAAAVSGLASCANYGGEPAAPVPSEGGATTGGAPGGAGLTVSKSEIPVGSGKIFTDAQAVVTQPEEGTFKAFTSICTHQGCPVASVTDTINCDCHGSKYSIADGSVVNPPAPNPLAAKTVTDDGDSLQIA